MLSNSASGVQDDLNSNDLIAFLGMDELNQRENNLSGVEWILFFRSTKT
jgi:hypothetical protein